MTKKPSVEKDSRDWLDWVLIVLGIIAAASVLGVVNLVIPLSSLSLGGGPMVPKLS